MNYLRKSNFRLAKIVATLKLRVHYWHQRREMP